MSGFIFVMLGKIENWWINTHDTCIVNMGDHVYGNYIIYLKITKAYRIKTELYLFIVHFET